MAAIVIGDVANLSFFVNDNNLCGLADGLESLFALYVVCYFY